MSHTGWIKNRFLRDGAVSPEKLDSKMRKTIKVEYEVTADGGSTGSKTLKDLENAAAAIPAQACIIGAHYEVIVPFTASGAATIALGYSGVTNAFKGATAFNHADYAEDSFKAATNSVPIKVTAEKSILLTIAGGTLTAGKMHIWVEYFEGSDS